MKKEEKKEELVYLIEDDEKNIYSCSVVISLQNIINMHGTIEEIREKLKFIENSLFHVEYNTDDSILSEPCILIQQDDVSDIRVFKLDEYKKECR